VAFPGRFPGSRVLSTRKNPSFSYAATAQSRTQTMRVDSSWKLSRTSEKAVRKHPLSTGARGSILAQQQTTEPMLLRAKLHDAPHLRRSCSINPRRYDNLKAESDPIRISRKAAPELAPGADQMSALRKLLWQGRLRLCSLAVATTESRFHSVYLANSE